MSLSALGHSLLNFEKHREREREKEEEKDREEKLRISTLNMSLNAVLEVSSNRYSPLHLPKLTTETMPPSLCVRICDVEFNQRDGSCYRYRSFAWIYMNTTEH
jgi:hypothetical protein